MGGAAGLVARMGTPHTAALKASMSMVPSRGSASRDGLGSSVSTPACGQRCGAAAARPECSSGAGVACHGRMIGGALRGCTAASPPCRTAATPVSTPAAGRLDDPPLPVDTRFQRAGRSPFDAESELRAQLDIWGASATRCSYASSGGHAGSWRATHPRASANTLPEGTLTGALALVGGGLAPALSPAELAALGPRSGSHRMGEPSPGLGDSPARTATVSGRARQPVFQPYPAESTMHAAATVRADLDLARAGQEEASGRHTAAVSGLQARASALMPRPLPAPAAHTRLALPAARPLRRKT
jgi:hypothetical protein